VNVSLVAMRCRTSDRTAGGVRGVDELAPLLGARLGCEARAIGEPSEPVTQGFEADLASARGCLLEAGGQIDDALSGGNVPLLLAGDCSIALTTVPTALRHRPDALVLWLDAHGDFNTPETTPSGYLGGMGLAGACGRWEAGLGQVPVPPARAVLAGVRDLEPAERVALGEADVTLIGASPVETLVAVKNALDGAPIYIHLDLDVLDPAIFPAQFPVPDGLAPAKLYDVLEAVAGDCEVVGVEVTAFEAPEDAEERQAAAAIAVGVLEPLLDVTHALAAG
jgi:arginase family enzyme